MRSGLFVPGDSERKLQKAADSGADALFIDLEDSVAADAKEDARAITAGYLAEAGDGPQLWVRVNAFDTGWLEADLAPMKES